jgi:hypothetical protein
MDGSRAIKNDTCSGKQDQVIVPWRELSTWADFVNEAFCTDCLPHGGLFLAADVILPSKTATARIQATKSRARTRRDRFMPFMVLLAVENEPFGIFSRTSAILFEKYKEAASTV